MARPVILPRTLTYKPVWTGVFEAWSRSWVAKHFWRVRSVLHTREDALQECALVWAKCAAVYTGKVDNAAWFMSLYKSSVARHWHTLSTADTECPERYRKDLPLTTTQDQEAIFGASPELPAGLLAARASNASNELVKLFSLLANAPNEVLNIVLSGDDETIINRRICRWLSFTSGTDVLRELRELLAD